MYFQNTGAQVLSLKENGTPIQVPMQAPQDAPGPEAEKIVKEDDRWYICRQCGQRIARIGERIRMQGSDAHTFANPSGIVYEIICFRSAEGVRFLGLPSSEFTWFAGFVWRVVICSACLTHIGWFFSNQGGNMFFGLISDRIKIMSRTR